jgi:hypothetical protein
MAGSYFEFNKDQLAKKNGQILHVGQKLFVFLVIIYLTHKNFYATLILTNT